MKSAITSILEAAGVGGPEEIREAPIVPSEPVAGVDPTRLKALRGLSKEDKVRDAFEWRMRGASVHQISQIFEVSVSTVYRWMQDYAEDFRKEIEQQPKANIIFERLLSIDRLKELALYELTMLDRDSKAASYDPDTGEVSRKANNDSGHIKVKWLDAALKCDRAAIRLMLETGVLQKEPDKIYHTLKGDVVGKEEEMHDDDRTDEEVLGDVQKLLAKGRRLTAV